jgi:hypothetical protein
MYNWYLNEKIISCYVGLLFLVYLVVQVLCLEAQTMTFESTPELSDITILNKAGKKVHVGKAPVTVSLKKFRIFLLKNILLF